MNDQTMNQRPARHQWLIIAALLALAVVPYARTLHHVFVNFDDNLYVTENVRVQQGITWENVKWAFTTVDAANWHPLTWLSHMLDLMLFKDWAGGHHLVSVLFHAVNSLLVWMVLHQMTGARWRSALAAALFAVHPLHVESVAWVAERKDVLSTCFGLLAIGAYVKYVARASARWYAMAAVFFALSLMSKAMLVTLPFVLLLLDFWPLKRLALPATGSAIARLFLEKVPLILISAAVSVVTFLAQRVGGSMSPIEILDVQGRLMNAVVAYAAYLYKTVWPVDLAVFYPLSKPSAWMVVVSAAVVITITAAAVWLSQKGRGESRSFLLVGWLWFLGTLVPVIGLVQIGNQSTADRYTYFPHIGVFIMVAWSVPNAITMQQRWIGWGMVTMCVAVVLALSVRTWSQVGYWRDSLSLFGHAIDVTSGNYLAHNNLGHACEKVGRRDEAMAHYSESIRIQPRYGVAHDNLGAALLTQGRLEEALPHFQLATKLQPRSAQSQHNLGAAYDMAGRVDEAIEQYQKAVRLRPDLIETHLSLGALHWRLRNTDQAIEHYSDALRYRPDLVDARTQLGVALAAMNRLDEAIVQFQIVLQSAPAHEAANKFLELALRERQNQPPQ